MDAERTDMPHFGELLRRARAAAALTQEELAERAGLSVRGISDLERGVKARPHRDTVRLLADALGLGARERAGLERAARPQAAGAAVARPPEAPPAGRTNLPVQLTSFVGRQRELGEVAPLLARARLLTLTGPGGTGKTRLALQLAAAALDRYAHGVWLVELAPLGDPALVPQAVATVLGVRGAGDRSPLEALCAAAGARHLLLVLDNCEHLLDACAALAEAMLRAGSQLQILATSRERLGSAGEVVWRVPALSLPESARRAMPETLEGSEAVQLFVERVAAVQPGFSAGTADAAAVAQVCRRLDGIPLALELAAALVGGLSVAQLAARLDQRFALLTGGLRTALPRQQTLQATVDWSYALLSPPEQALFARLSVFAGGFALEAAEAVCAGNGLDAGEVLDGLLRLVDKSLVLAEAHQGGETRYRLLETLRQYGEQRLPPGEAATLHARHAAYYLALAQETERHFRRPGDSLWMARLDADYGNLAAALEWCLPDGEPRAPGADGGDAETGLRLAGGLWWFWNQRQHQWAGERWLERALARSGEAASSARAQALLGAGVRAWFRADYGRARRLLDESVAMYRVTGPPEKRVVALTIGGYLARGVEVCFDNGYTGEYESGTALLEEALALARTTGNPWLVLQALLALAPTSDVHRGEERARGRAAAEEGLRLVEAVGGDFDACELWRTLGGLAFYEGQFSQADAAFSRALDAARRAGDNPAIAAAHNSLGDVARARGRQGEAAARYGESLALYRTFDFDEEWRARVLCHLAAGALDRGDSALARTHLGESLRTARDLAARGEPRIAPALEGLAAVAAAQGQAERALRLAGAAAALRARSRQLAWPLEAEAYTRWLAPARRALGEQALGTAWAEGQAMPVAAAIALALEGDTAGA